MIRHHSVKFAKLHAQAVYDERSGKDEMVNQLDQKGWYIIGQGSFSYVMAHPRHPKIVLKISSVVPSRDIGYCDGWHEFCFWMRDKKVKTSYAPKIYWIEGPRHAPVFITVVERLYNLEDQKFVLPIEMAALDAKWKADKGAPFANGIYNPEKLRHLEMIASFMHRFYEISEDIIFDIHRHNIMQRADGTPVISDPIVFDSYYYP